MMMMVIVALLYDHFLGRRSWSRTGGLKSNQARNRGIILGLNTSED